MKKLNQRILTSMALLVVIVTAGLLARRYSSFEWLVHQESALRDAVKLRPLTAWFAGIGIYFAMSLAPSITGKAVIIGWLYGFVPGVLLVDLALTGAALTTFLASRYLFREAIEQRFGLHLLHFQKKLRGDAAFYLITMRMLHAPFAFMNYVAGSTNIVPVRTFWWTTQLGILPGTMVFVFAGTRIPTLSQIAEAGVMSLLDGPLIAALVATSVSPLILRVLSVQLRRVPEARAEDSAAG